MQPGAVRATLKRERNGKTCGKSCSWSWIQDGSDQMPLKLMDSKAFSTGVVSLVYQPAGT
jgi:hypothetical protein